MMCALICAFVNFNNNKAIQFYLHVYIYDINKLARWNGDRDPLNWPAAMEMRPRHGSSESLFSNFVGSLWARPRGTVSRAVSGSSSSPNRCFQEQGHGTAELLWLGAAECKSHGCDDACSQGRSCQAGLPHYCSVTNIRCPKTTSLGAFSFTWAQMCLSGLPLQTDLVGLWMDSGPQSHIWSIWCQMYFSIQTFGGFRKMIRCLCLI